MRCIYTRSYATGKSKVVLNKSSFDAIQKVYKENSALGNNILNKLYPPPRPSEIMAAHSPLSDADKLDKIGEIFGRVEEVKCEVRDCMERFHRRQHLALHCLKNASPELFHAAIQTRTNTLTPSPTEELDENIIFSLGLRPTTDTPPIPGYKPRSIN